MLSSNPVNSYPESVIARQDILYSFTDDNMLSVQDADADLVSTQLTVNPIGILRVTDPGEAILTGNESSDLTIRGTQADINAALETLTYQVGADFMGMDTLTMFSTDGASLTDTDHVTINVVPAEYVVTGQLGTGGGSAALYVDGIKGDTSGLGDTGQFDFHSQVLDVGDTIVVIKEQGEGSATFAELGFSGPNISLPDNNEADTHRIVATMAGQGGTLTNADFFTAFAGLTASQHPFDASVNNDMALEENYQLAIVGSSSGETIYQPSGALTVTGAKSKFSLVEQDSGAIDMQIDSGIVVTIDGGAVMHGAGNTITVDQANFKLTSGADYFLSGNLQFGPADGFSTSTDNGCSLTVLGGGVLSVGNPPLVFDSITVESGGDIEPSATGIGLDLQVNSLLVAEGGTIHADDRGHGAGTGPGCGGAALNGGGGGHGGRGGNGRYASNGGGFNDSGLLPSDFGSGGGSGSR
ncbi:MAG: hypothetical protein ABGZ35_17295, partial [Planctomycetaceae bacterium]